MSILIDSGSKVFDTDQLHVGDVIYAKRNGWPEGRAGIITYVTKRCLTVVFHPAIANVMLHFHIRAEEVQANEWEYIRWSSDLDAVTEGLDVYADEGMDIITDENNNPLAVEGETA